MVLVHQVIQLVQNLQAHPKYVHGIVNFREKENKMNEQTEQRIVRHKQNGTLLTEAPLWPGEPLFPGTPFSPFSPGGPGRPEFPCGPSEPLGPWGPSLPGKPRDPAGP